MSEVYIASARRTPTGSFLGSLSTLGAVDLGALCIRAVYEDINLAPHDVQAVYMGNVLSANLGQSPARQASIHAGLPPETDCTTINKVCSSGLKATVIAAQQIQLGIHDIVVAGGMESMSNAPHYLVQRGNHKLGHLTLTDGVLKDGLSDAFDNQHMGVFADACAAEFTISRSEQDDYALRSYQRAQQATDAGFFKKEILPIHLTTAKGSTFTNRDEDIDKLVVEKLPLLKPAFTRNGTVTAANASNLNDGAAAVLLASKSAVERHGLNPIAKIVAYSDAALSPQQFTIAPAKAIRQLLDITKMNIEHVDYFEINEAYAAVALANQRLLNIDDDRLNVFGGAVAIGHPLGASGARILCTLTSILRHNTGRFGIAAICNGGGGSTAILIENLIH